MDWYWRLRRPIETLIEHGAQRNINWAKLPKTSYILCSPGKLLLAKKFCQEKSFVNKKLPEGIYLVEIYKH